MTFYDNEAAAKALVEERKRAYIAEFGRLMRGRGFIHVVKDCWMSTGWEKGKWRLMVAACGLQVRHHPTKRDFRVILETEVDCLGCIAAVGA